MLSLFVRTERRLAAIAAGTQGGTRVRRTNTNGTVRLLGLALLLATSGFITTPRAQDPSDDENTVVEEDAAAEEADDADDEAAAPDPDDTSDEDDAEFDDFDDGSTATDEFTSIDWAPDVPDDDDDDVLDTDESLDPADVDWVVTAEVQDVPGPDGHRGNGDYAGPSPIFVMQPRPAPAAPKPGPGAGKDTAYSFGGQPIAPGAAPWQAQLYRSLAKERPGVSRWKAQHNCGGTLIAPGWILTAAHCIDDILDDREAGWRVRLGGRDLTKDDGITYAVDRWVRHSGYKNVGHPAPPKPPLAPPNMYSNDIGLVHFTADAQTKPPAGAKPVQPVELYRNAIKGGDEVTAIGWGMTQNAAKSFSAVPLKVDLRVMDTAMCRSRPGYGPERVDTSVICAAREGQKTCRGDSGGPVILTNGTTPRLVGLVSWGKTDCSGDGRPSVFTRLEAHLAWIEQAMKLPETRASLP